MTYKKSSKMVVPVISDTKIVKAMTRPAKRSIRKGGTSTKSRPLSKYKRRESNAFGRGTRTRTDAYGTLKRVLIEKRDIEQSRKQHYWVRVKPKK